MTLHRRFSFILMAALAASSLALSAAEAPRTGSYTTTYAETSPFSAWPVFVDHAGAMFGASKGGGEPSTYRIAEESFEVYVPKAYDGSRAYGLIAFISPAKGGGPSGEYQQVCDAHKLMWVACANVPNEREPTSRARLTIDAVFNMAKRYRVDPNRVYVSGMSGGGRVASHLAVPCGDVFTGGAIFLCGCNSLVMPGDAALAKRMDELAHEHRFAFMTGSEDMNKPGTQQVFHQYQSMKLPFEKYFEQPGMGHESPNKKYFDDAVTWLDEPLVAKAAAQLAAGKAAEGKKRWREAWTAYDAAAGSAIAEAVAAEAQPLLANAVTNLDVEAAKDLEKALAKPQASALRTFATKWPATLPSTAKARAAAEGLAGEELDKLVAAKPTAAALRAFLKTWDGYDIVTRALEALNDVAKESWTKVDALKPGLPRIRALARFVADWTPTASAASASETLASEVQTELGEIAGLASPAAKANRLQALLKEVKGTPAGVPVEAAVTALNAENAPKKPH